MSGLINMERKVILDRETEVEVRDNFWTFEFLVYEFIESEPTGVLKGATKLTSQVSTVRDMRTKITEIEISIHNIKYIGSCICMFAIHTFKHDELDSWEIIFPTSPYAEGLKKHFIEQYAIKPS